MSHFKNHDDGGKRRSDNGNKEVYDYLVSRPFDGWVDGFTAYAFGKGIRRFRFDEIVDREVVLLFGKSVA